MSRPKAKKPVKCDAEIQTDPVQDISHLSLDELLNIIQNKVCDILAPKLKAVENTVETNRETFEKTISSTNKQVKILEEMMYEDKEILLGLDHQMDNSIPDKFSDLEDKLMSNKENVEGKIENTTMRLSQQNEHLNSKVQENTIRVDAMDQQLKARNVVIFGLPEVEGKPEDCVVNLARETLGMENFKATDIESMYRPGKPSQDAPSRKLVVKFKSKRKRDDFYMRRKRTPIHEEISRNVYINEDLTTFRSKLFHDCRKLVKQGKLHSSWSQSGNIMIKLKSDDRPRPVFNHQELRAKLYEENQMESSDIELPIDDIGASSDEDF